MGKGWAEKMKHNPFEPSTHHSADRGGMFAKDTGQTVGAIKERREIDGAFKWRTVDLFPSDEAWEKAYGELKAALSRAASFKGRLGGSAKVLLEAFQAREGLSVQLEQVFAYASLNKDTDTRDPQYQDRYDRAYALAVDFETAFSFMEPEILSIPEAVLQTFLAEEEGLKVYGHALDDLMRQRAHVLSEKEEALIARAGNVFRAPSDAFNMLTDADLTFPKIRDEDGNEVATSNALYYKFRGSKDRRVRRENEEAFHGTFRKFRNTLASLIRSNVYKASFNAEVRGYESSLHAALHAPNIPLEVYQNLIRTVNDHLAPLHRYTRLRKKILGLDAVHGYDLYNSLFPDADMKVSYEEARKLLAGGLKPLGEEYLGFMRNGLKGGWVDVYENAGKRSGAYSAGIYGVHPFILLNYQDRLDDAFTLAHEFGHAMHSFYSQKNQPKVYADYTIFNAEAASTTNESLLMHHLLEVTKDRSKRRYLLDFYLDSIRSTFYRQTLFAEFELEIHSRVSKGESLTADLLDTIYGGLFEKYYGPAFVLDEFKTAEWSRVPHFYRSFYAQKAPNA